MNYCKIQDMDSSSKKRLEERIVSKVSKSILYKIDAFDRMRQRYWEARDKSLLKCNPPKSTQERDRFIEYGFESFYYACLEKWEKGELK